MAWGEESILIDNASAIASETGVEHSAIFTNLRDALITFDALIRLDTENEVLMLDFRTITLEQGSSITIEGIFSITQPGSYVVQWEALSPPPGEPIAARRQVTVEIIEGGPEELDEPVVLEEEEPLPEEPVDPKEPLDPINQAPAQDDPREEEPPADPIVDPIEKAPDLVIEEPAADPFPPDPVIPPADPVIPPAADARNEAPAGDAPVIVPPVGGELPDLSPPVPPPPPPPPQLAGIPVEQATISPFNALMIVAIGVVVAVSVGGIILRRKVQNWKYEPLFTDE